MEQGVAAYFSGKDLCSVLLLRLAPDGQPPVREPLQLADNLREALPGHRCLTHGVLRVLGPKERSHSELGWTEHTYRQLDRCLPSLLCD